MRIEGGKMQEMKLENFYGGKKELYANMYADEKNRILRGRLEPGASIGAHAHESSSEIIFILSGSGVAVCDSVQEELYAGICHYCPKGHTHCLKNTGTEPLAFFAVVPQQ